MKPDFSMPGGGSLLGAILLGALLCVGWAGMSWFSENAAPMLGAAIERAYAEK